MSDSQTPHDDPVPAHSLRAVWAAIAVLCVAGGVLGSLLVAHTVAHNDATSARQASQQASAAIASTVKLSLLREEDLRIGGGTYFAGNSKTTPAEFDRWVAWARTLRHFPELEQPGLVTLVHGDELTAFGGRSPASVKPAATPIPRRLRRPRPPRRPPRPRPPRSLRSRPGAAGRARARPFYCLTLANLARARHENPPAGRDYCADGTAPAGRRATPRGQGRRSSPPRAPPRWK